MNKMWIAVCALSAGCMHGSMMGDTEERPGQGQTMMGGQSAAWPSVRIDEPAGAHVTMDRGIFGEGLDVVTPFQGQFQTTGTLSMTGYPLEIHLDDAVARRYGGTGATTLYARLTVAANRKTEPVRIAPSECELRALLTGEVQEIRTEAEQMPSVQERCAMEEHDRYGAVGSEHPQCGGGGGGCAHHGGPHGPGPQHGCGGGHGHGHGGGWFHHAAPTVLKIRLAKF